MDKNYLSGSSSLILLSLISRKDMYGYELIKELEILSDMSFQFKEGTLYPILHKLENMRWIESYITKAETGKERKYYKITRLGLQQLHEEKKKWKEFQDSLNKVLGGSRYVGQF